MLIEYLRVCGSDFHAVFVPDHLPACHRQQKKELMGEKRIVELLKNVDT